MSFYAINPEQFKRHHHRKARRDHGPSTFFRIFTAILGFSLYITPKSMNCDRFANPLTIPCHTLGKERSEHQVLGVKIYEHLKWKKHIDLISKKLSCATAMLKYISSILPQHVLKNLYTSIVVPHFRYCSSVWGYCGKSEINKLQKSKNRAVQLITHSKLDIPCNSCFLNMDISLSKRSSIRIKTLWCLSR